MHSYYVLINILQIMLSNDELINRLVYDFITNSKQIIIGNDKSNILPSINTKLNSTRAKQQTPKLHKLPQLTNLTKYPSFNEHIQKMMILNNCGSTLNYCDIVIAGESHQPKRAFKIRRAEYHKPSPIRIPVSYMNDFKSRKYQSMKPKKKMNIILKRTAIIHSPKIYSQAEKSIELVLNKLEGHVSSKSTSALKITKKKDKIVSEKKTPTNEFAGDLSDKYLTITNSPSVIVKNDYTTVNKSVNLKKHISPLKQNIIFGFDKHEEIRPWTRSSNNSLQ